MIKVDFSVAVAIGMISPVIIAALLWFFMDRAKEKTRDLTLNPKYIWYCSVCTYTYIYTKQEAFSICPRCGSYNLKDKDKK